MNDMQNTKGYDVVKRYLICSQWPPCPRYQSDKTEVVMLSHSDTRSNRFPFDCCGAASVKNVFFSNYLLTQLYLILHRIHGAHCKSHSKTG